MDTKYTIILSSLIIGLSVLGYGYMDYKHKQAVLAENIRLEVQQRQELKTKEETNNYQNTMMQFQLEQCLNDVVKLMQGASEIKGGTSEDYKMLMNFFEARREECFKKYSSNN